MLPQRISGLADFLAHFTDVCYIQMCFTVSLHISPVRKLFTTVGTSVFHEGSVVSLSHKDHGVQDSGQSLFVSISPSHVGVHYAGVIVPFFITLVLAVLLPILHVGVGHNALALLVLSFGGHMGGRF